MKNPIISTAIFNFVGTIWYDLKLNLKKLINLKIRKVTNTSKKMKYIHRYLQVSSSTLKNGKGNVYLLQSNRSSREYIFDVLNVCFSLVQNLTT